MNGKSLVIGLVLLILGVGAGYYFATNFKITPQEAATTETTTTEPTSATSVTETTTAVPTASPTVDEKAALLVAVKAGLVAEHGPTASSMNVTVSKIQGNFASGGAVDPNSVGGAMWLAAKVNGKWVLVWDGNGTIPCETTDPYNFPVSLLPECWNEATGKIVVR